jgi:hypothetical protein
VLVNDAAEGWNLARHDRHASAPTASKRLPAADRRIMRVHPRKEAGVVIDFTPKAATQRARRLAALLLDADFYRGCACHPCPRRRTVPRAPQADAGVGRPRHA